MTIYYVNTGSSPNAGNGDSLRVAFNKINNNFGELVDQIGNIEVGTTSTLVAGTYTFALSTSGDVTLNGEPFVSSDGLTGPIWQLTSSTAVASLASDGVLTVPGNIIGAATIAIDNRDSGTTADINLYSADDILIQARDRAIGSTAEGGDINIFAGDSAEDSDTSAGDIVIEAGRGGASNIDYGGTGGVISIRAGDGGDAIGASVSARPGGYLTLRAGDAGDNNSNIDLGNAGGDITMQAGDSTGNGIPGGSVYIKSGNGDSSAEGGPDGNVVIQTGSNGSTWTFGTDGTLNIPGDIKRDGVSVLGGGNGVLVATTSTAPTATTGTQWFDTVEGRTYVATDGLWLDASPTQIPSPETYLDGLAIDGTVISTANVDGDAIVIDGGNNTRLTVSTSSVTIQTLGSGIVPLWWSMYGDLDRNISDEFGAGSVYDGDGNLYVVGTFQTEGPDNLLLIKYDSTGQVLWSKSYANNNVGGPGGDPQIYGESIIFDSVSGNLFILTTQENSWFGIIEMTTAGNIVRWVHGDTDVEITGTDLTIDPSGNIYVMANRGSVEGGQGTDYLIIKLDATTLDVVWAKSLDYGATVDEPNQGQGFGALEYSNGYIYATGGVGLGGEGGNLAYLVKLDATDGSLDWGTDAPSLTGMGLCLDDNDNVYITLTANEEAGLSAIAKFNSSGTFQWAQQLMLFQGGGDVDINYDLGYLYATGVVYDEHADGPSSSGLPGWIHWAKVNATTGDIVYQQKFGNATNTPLTDVWRFYGHDLGGVYDGRLSISAFAYESTGTSDVAANMITLQLPLTHVTTGTYGQYEITDFVTTSTSFTTTNSFSAGMTITVATYVLEGSETFINGSTSTVVVDNTLTFYTQAIGETSNTTSTVSTWTFVNNNIILPPGGDILDSNGVSVLGGSTTALGDRLTAGSNSVILGSTGTLTLPQGGVISETLSSYNNAYSILLTPNPNYNGAVNPDMAVKIYPTFNDDNHIHITAGNTGTVDLFLGDDDQYVKIEKNHGNIVVGTNTDTNQWTFGTDGALEFPLGSTISETNTTTIISPPGASAEQSLVIRPTGSTSTTETNHIHLISGNPTTVDLFLGDDDQYVKIEKNGGNIVVGTYSTATTSTWTFGTDGVLTLSTASTILGSGTDPNVYIETATTSTTSTWTFGTDGVLILPAATPVIKGGGTGTDVTVIATTGTNTSTWTFAADGTTTLPIGVSIDEYNGSHFPRIVAESGKAFSVQGEGSTGSVALQWMETAFSTSSRIVQVGLNKFGDGLAKVVLNVGTSENDIKTWKFDETGTTTLASGVEISNTGTFNFLSWNTGTALIIADVPYTAGSYIYIPSSSDTNGSLGIVNTNTAGSIMLTQGSGNNTTNQLYVNNSGTTINNILGGISKTWTFGTNGSLTFPDSTVQTTAYTGAISTSTLVNGTSTVSLSSTGTVTFPDGTVQTTAYSSVYTGWFKAAGTVVQLDTLLARINSTGTMQISSTIVESIGQGSAFAWNGVRNKGATMSSFGQGGTNWVNPGDWLDISATPLDNNFEVATVSVFKLGGTGSLYRITYVGSTSGGWAVNIERVALG